MLPPASQVQRPTNLRPQLRRFSAQQTCDPCFAGLKLASSLEIPAQVFLKALPLTSLTVDFPN
jgi:hypothetical protein